MPDGDTTATRPPNTSGYQDTFTVTNNESQLDTYEITCRNGAPVTSCHLDQPNQGLLTLDVGLSAKVPVDYAVGAAGAGRLVLDAAGFVEDTGWYNVPVAVPSYAPSVTPDGGSQTVYHPSTGNVATFTVQNAGNQGTLTYALTIQGCTSPLTNCSSDSSSVTLTQGASKAVTAHFDAQDILGAGTITLRATHTASGAHDDGSINVTTIPLPFSLNLSQNFKDRLDKAGCVTGNAGPGAAFYCGELLVMQPLVGYRSFNKLRVPTLVWSSRAVNAAAEVLIDVRLPGDTAVPSKVLARVSLNGVANDSAYFSTAGWSAGTTRRLVIPLKTASLTQTHVYMARVDVRRIGGSTITNTDSIPIVAAKRASSPFGKGWWLGGVDRAFLGDSSGTAIVFLDAEGSAVVFRKVNGLWVAPQGETSRLVVDTTCVHGVCTSHYKRTLKNQDVLRYDLTTGRLLTATDPVGNVATYTWVTNGVDGLQLASITDEAGKVVTFTYTNNRLSSVSVPGALATKVYVNGTSFNIDSIVDPDSVKTSFVYNGSTNLMTSRTGRRTGETSTYSYVSTIGAQGLLASITTPDGTLNHVAYQAVGHPASGTGTSSSPAPPAVEDSVHVTLRDYRGIATKINVDRLGRPTRIAPPDSGIVTITRHAGTSLPTQIAWTPLGRTVKLNWDTTWADLLSSIEVADNNATTQYQYQPKFHALTQVTTPMGLVTRYAYDTTNAELDTIIAPGGDRTTLAYNSVGQVRSILEPGHTYPTEYGYDSLGARNLVWIKSPQSHVQSGNGDDPDSTVFVYDTSKTLATQVIAPKTTGHVVTTTYTFDALHRVKKVDIVGDTAPSRHITVAYPKGDRVASYTLPSGVVNVFRTVTDSFDAMGRLTAACTPAIANHCDRSSYTNGFLTQTRVADSALTAFNLRNWTYDSLGRVQKASFTTPILRVDTNPHAIYADTNRFFYNQLGAISQASDSISLVRRSYDAVGRLACEQQLMHRWVQHDTTNGQRIGIKYYYDADGRLTKRVFGSANWQAPPAGHSQDACVFPNADTATIRLVYDVHDRVDSIVGWNIKTGSTAAFHFGFDAAGRRDTITNSHNTWRQILGYNENDLPSKDSIAWIGHNATLVEDSFDLRDDAGRVLKRLEFGALRRYAYDPLGEVVLENTRPDAYDSLGAGQIIGQTGAIGQAENYWYNTPTGRIDSTETPCNPQCVQTLIHRYRYDQGGNRTRDTVTWNAFSCSTWEHVVLTSYDGAGRPVSMRQVKTGRGGCAPDSLPRDSVNHWWTYWYDALGRRILVGDSVPYPTYIGMVQRFFYDGDNTRISGSVRFGNFMDASVGLHFNETDAYINDVGVNEPLYWFADVSDIAPGCSTAELFYLRDERNNVVGIARDTNLFCYQSSYTGYGQFISGRLSDSKPAFSGAPSDASGLVFMRNRYYDPNTGTFTQADPSGLFGGMNLYGYVGNDPIAYTDPFGLKVCFQGTSEQVALLKQATEKATNTRFDLDKAGCVAEGTIQSGGAKGFGELQALFRRVVGENKFHTLEITYNGATRTTGLSNTRTYINPAQAYVMAYHTSSGGWRPYGGDVGTSVAHELLGHGTDPWWRPLLVFDEFTESHAIEVENLYLSAVGLPPRVNYGSRCLATHGCPEY